MGPNTGQRARPEAGLGVSVTHVDKVKLCYEREDEMMNERRLVPEVETTDDRETEDRIPRPKRNVRPPSRLIHDC